MQHNATTCYIMPQLKISIYHINNKILIDVERAIIYYNLCLKIKINHVVSYGFYEGAQDYYLYYNNNYKYIKQFNKRYISDISGFYNLYKNSLLKRRMLIKNNNIIYDIVYSYFIYNKYYNFSNRKEYYFNFNKLINSNKLFNCRDYYKIYSYII